MFSAPETLADELGAAGRRRLPLPSCRAPAHGSRRPSRARRCASSSPPPGSMPGSLPTIPSAATSPGCSSPPSRTSAAASSRAACTMSRARSQSAFTAHGGNDPHPAEVARRDRGRRPRAPPQGRRAHRHRRPDRRQCRSPPSRPRSPRRGRRRSRSTDAIKRYEWGPSFFGIYLALDGPVAYRAGPAAVQVGYLHAADVSIDHLAGEASPRSAAAVCRRGRWSASSTRRSIDPSRAPPGKALMKFIVHFVPYRVAGTRGRIAAELGRPQGRLRRRHPRLARRGVPPRLAQPSSSAQRAVAARLRAPHAERSSTAPTSTAPSCPIRSAPFGRCRR